MRGALILGLAALLALGGGAARALGGSVDAFQNGPASSLELATLEALPNMQRDLSEFTRPMDPAAEPVAYDGPNLTGIAAVTMEVEGDGFAGMMSMEDVTGTDGEYLTRIGFTVNGFGDPVYYSTNQWATLYLAEFDGEPVAPDGGVMGISLSWNWAGQEGLSVSPFPNDPLTGYANNAEEGTIDGQPFRVFSSVSQGTWVEYEHQVLTMSGPITRDTNWYFAWAIPGVPEEAAVTLSYATDSEDPNTLVSQQMTLGNRLSLGIEALVTRYSELTSQRQRSLDEQWMLTSGDDTPTTTVPSEPADDEPGEQVLVDEPLDGGTFDTEEMRWIGAGLLLLILGILGWNRGWFSKGVSESVDAMEETGEGPEPELGETLGTDDGVIPS